MILKYQIKMDNPIFQNPVGAIYKESIQVDDVTITIKDLSVVQYTIVQNGKIDFYLIIVAIVLTIVSLIFQSLLSIVMAATVVLISQVMKIKQYALVFGIHKNQKIVTKEISGVNELDIKLFINQFHEIKSAN